MARLKLTLSYIGTAFAGWQLQIPPHAPPPRTVQGVVEEAVASILANLNLPKLNPADPGMPGLAAATPRITAAGRTDSGVHADAQVAHLDIPDSALRVNWRDALNQILPPDLRVMRSEQAPPGFHARSSAISKTYNYALWLEHRSIPPRLAPFAWECGPLDLAPMDQAAALLTGEHDFSAFRNAGADPGSGSRTLHSVTRHPATPPGITTTQYHPQNPDLYTIWTFTGSGFLKQMVRNLMGLLVFVGQHKITPQQIPRLLQAQSRPQLPSPTAPAHGLTLHCVRYEPRE